MKSNITWSINKKTFIPKFAGKMQQLCPFILSLIGCYFIDGILSGIFDKKNENLS